MSFPDYDYGSFQILYCKNLCFKSPKYAKCSTINQLYNHREVYVQPFKAYFTVIINFTMIYTSWAEKSDPP